MKCIIAGSRGGCSFSTVVKAIRAAEKKWGQKLTEGVSGNAKGIDRLGEDWCRWTNTPIKYFYPNWKAHGKRAGLVRNGKMAEYAEALVAVWDGKSKGTRHMIAEAKERNLKVHVKRI